MRRQHGFGGRFVARDIMRGRSAGVFDNLRIAILVPRQGCIDQAGDERIDGNLVRAKFQRRGLHQSDQAPLRRRIGGAEFGAMLGPASKT